jgi:hypothetical protein
MRSISWSRVLATFAIAMAGSAAGPARAQDAPAIEAAVVQETLIARGAAWKFLRGSAVPAGGALDWTQPDFDDPSWESGAAGFGYGDGDDATALDDMRGRYTTVLIRRDFEVGEPAAFDALELAIDYDDGFIAFLNGREVARDNVGAAGPADLVVAGAGGEASLAGAFTYYEVFRRGDANRDGRRDLADALFILGVLFQGSETGGSPLCRETADANGDGALDVSDAVFLLLYLFAGGASPGAADVRCGGAGP